MTSGEVAARLGISLRRVRALAKSGQLPAIKVGPPNNPGSRYIFRVEDVEAFAAIDRPPGRRPHRKE